MISLSPDHATAEGWLKQLRSEGIAPNVVTYNTMISLSPDYATAEGWLKQLRSEGIAPNMVTYFGIFSKGLSPGKAKDLLEKYLREPYHPEEPIQTAIASYRRIGSPDDAFYLSLHYPHLPVARKLFRELSQIALPYYEAEFKLDPANPNSSYALGIALCEANQEEKAIPLLRKALTLANKGPRQTMLRELLRRLTQKSKRGR
jgi:tetratricopeptide (TPR) repeat protein